MKYDWKWKLKRWIKFWLQRRLRGWDDSDTWSLDHTIAEFVLPRLKKLKELNDSYPQGLTETSWDEVLDDIIYSMEIVALEWELADYTIIDWDRVKKGHQFFGKYFRDLWW